MKRTPSQKAAVRAVRIAAKRVIEEIDRYQDPRMTKFHADFHLERWRIEPVIVPGQPWTSFQYGEPIYKAASTIAVLTTPTPQS